jgi:hypothetical protein
MPEAYQILIDPSISEEGKAKMLADLGIDNDIAKALASVDSSEWA